MNPLLEIETILQHKIVNDCMLFLVKWKNYNYDFNVWMPMSRFPSLKLVYEYCLKNNVNYIPVPCTSKRAKEIFDSLACVPDEVINKVCEQFVSMYTDDIRLPPSNKDAILHRIEQAVNKDELQTNPKLLQELREQVIVEKVIERRTEQLNKLQEQEWWINSCSDNIEAIKLTNNRDLEILPENFKYVNSYISGPNITLPEISDDMFACSGDHKICTKKCSCINLFSDKAPYDKNGTIVSMKHEVVHECNKLCSCGPLCGNRVVQKGCAIKIEIFRSALGTGWAVRTLEFLLKGTFIGKYVGYIITWEEGELLSNSQVEGQYLFDIDYWKDDEGHSKYTVDAFEYGNFTRFINHSCSPNLTVYRVWINCLDPHLHEIAFFTTRNIEKGEELTFNYRKLFDECKCGSSRCVPNPKKPRLT